MEMRIGKDSLQSSIMKLGLKQKSLLAQHVSDTAKSLNKSQKEESDLPFKSVFQSFTNPKGIDLKA